MFFQSAFDSVKSVSLSLSSGNTLSAKIDFPDLTMTTLVLYSIFLTKIDFRDT